MDSAMAQPLIVRGGEALDGMDFMVPTASAVLISGRVVPEASGPATGVVRTFYLLPRDGRPMEAYPAEFKNMRTPAAGQDNTEFSLEVRGLAPGLYDLAPFFIDSDNQYHSGRTRIEIGDRNIEDLAVPPGANVHVQGRIVVEGEKSFQDWGGLQLQLRAKEPAVPLMQRSNTARIMPDGTFSIPAVFEGLYQIHLYAGSRSRSKDLYVSAIRQGGLDLRDEGSVDVRPSMLPLEITLSSGTGIVRGVVDAAAGETPSYAHVVLIPQASRRANALFYDRTTIDDRGRFVFQGVAPGEYKVFAFERLADTAERNPAFLARYETLGSSVTVNPGITTEIRVRFVR
jgi:hypothetical protein